MLAVVENDEDGLVAERRNQSVHRRTAGLDAQLQGLRDRPRHLRRVAHRRELDEPDTLTAVVEHFCSRLESEASLPGSAGAGERHEANRAQELDHLGKLLHPPHERTERGRQVVG